MTAKAAMRGNRKRTPDGSVSGRPDLAVVYRSVLELVPYAKNARTHSDAQIAQIAAAITEFGFTNPVLIDETKGLIAGHGRVLAAKSLGLGTIPTITLAGLSAAKKRALILADNKLALNAAWDMDLLRLELTDLRAGGFDLNMAGFDAAELVDIFATKAGHTDPDDAPPVEERVISKPGDVWILGAHRLTCGDATERAVVTRVIGEAKPHLMVTDPPYGVNYDANWRNNAFRKDGSPIGGRAVGKVENDGRADWRAAWALFPGSVAYVWHGGLHASVVEQSLEAAKFKIRSQIIWVKTRPVIGRGDYHWQHEPAVYAVAEEAADDHWNLDHEEASYAVLDGKPGQWAGGRKQSTVWTIEHIKSETGHSTQKPVECMARPIRNNSKPGDAVYEPFSGSGTTLLACEIAGRRCLAVELNPAYCDVTIRRWQNFTGKEAKLESTNKSFEKVSQQRAKS